MKTRNIDNINNLDIELSKAFNLAIDSVDDIEDIFNKNPKELKRLFQNIYDRAFNAYFNANEKLPDFYDDYLWNLNDVVMTKKEYNTEEDYRSAFEYYLSEFAEEISWDIEDIIN